MTRLITPLIASTLFAIACTPVSPAEEVASDLELDNGGLDTTDEAPEFGDAATFTAAAVEADTAITDTMDADATVTDLRTRADATHLRVAIVWGQMPPDRDATTGHDWSGRIQISRGALVVKRTIGFEAATDQLMPRTARDAVAFASMTKPFADGLVLEVLTDAADLSTVTLTYTSRDGATTAAVPLAALIAGPVSADVGADGDRIVATALRAGDACDHGFVRGRWHALRPGLGRFLGVATDADGQRIGHLRGIWGQRDSGAQVFFGKYIDGDGRFRGLMVGSYVDGTFRGRWIVGTGDHGLIHGMYRDGAATDAIGGAFVGRWAETSCAADLPSS
ncbi:MAG: hypothetical protein IPL61_33655 [Myxococcales bacterium]|nr:hypothetical protein [Myxococcales bacterium]